FANAPFRRGVGPDQARTPAAMVRRSHVEGTTPKIGLISDLGWPFRPAGTFAIRIPPLRQSVANRRTQKRPIRAAPIQETRDDPERPSSIVRQRPQLLADRVGGPARGRN